MESYAIEYRTGKSTKPTKTIPCDNLETAIALLQDLVNASSVDSVTLIYCRDQTGAR